VAVTTYRGVTFNKGDKVRIMADWIEGTKPTAIISGFQCNGGIRFAIVQWKSRKLSEEYGNLFTFDELKKV
jgi:hypothetical protein